MKKQKKERSQEEKVQIQKKASVSVWRVRKSIAPKSTLDIEWPEFKNEKERIKAYSQRYASVSITEAMTGVKANEPEIPLPTTLRLGSILPVRIARIHQKGVDLKDFQSKEVVVCKNNLHRYEKLRKFLPIELLDAQVVNIDKQTVYVDIIQPMISKWVGEVLKNPSIQADLNSPRLVTVENLQLTKGGYIGKAIVPTVSEFIGEPYYVDAFIPGSQIVLNIEEDFERWNGKTVSAFIAGYVPKPNAESKMSLVCSVKSFLTYLGDKEKIEMFNHYCLDDQEWKKIVNVSFNGKVTGIINSSKKCGVFIEIPSLNITGMVSTQPNELTKYHPHMDVIVKITGFEEMTYFDSASGQRLHSVPYTIENNCIKNCILKPILELA